MQLVATLAVVASVLVLAFQTRQLTHQSHLGNQVAATKADREIFSMFARVWDGFLQYPEVRPFFYDQTTDTPSAAVAARLEVTAEKLADACYIALETTVKLAAYGYRLEDWTLYVTSQLGLSTPLRSIIRDHPGYWPALDVLMEDHDLSRDLGPDSPAVPLVPAGNLPPDVRP